MTGAALPAGHKMQKVLALPSFPVVLAVLARKFNRHREENRGPCNIVSQLEEPRVEVDFRRERRDANQCRHPHNQ
eukprot:2066154-Rhodomonas_salina.3